jgi:D-3-phosphoglycerate dehydrogenase
VRVLLVSAPALGHREDEVAASLRQAGIDVTHGDPGALDPASFDVIAGPGTMSIDAALMDRCPRLRGLVSFGIGCEGFDHEAAVARSIEIVTGRTERSASDMGSATVALMLALCHDLPGAVAAFAQGRRCDSRRARTLDDAVVGIVGYGAIGQDVARRLTAWGVRVLVHGRSLEPGPFADGSESVPLATLLEASDVVSLHATLAYGDPPIIGHSALGSMKPGALLVNTARGGLLDEGVVAAALHSGRLGGAALDCFAVEPLPADSPLRTAPHTILTPHQIGHTRAGADAMVRTFTDNIIRLASAGARP